MTGCWTATFLVLAPRAGTVTVGFDSEPEHREIEAMCERLGVVASVEIRRPCAILSV